MSIEAALYSLLSGNGAITAIVSTRIYWKQAPQNAGRPFLVYSQEGEQGDLTLSGPSGLYTYNAAIDAQAADGDTLIALCKAVRNLLDGYRGGALSVSIQSSIYRAGPDGTPVSDDPPIFARVLNFDILYQE